MASSIPIASGAWFVETHPQDPPPPLIVPQDCGKAVGSSGRFYRFNGPDGKPQPLCTSHHLKRLYLTNAKCEMAGPERYANACGMSS